MNPTPLPEPEPLGYRRPSPEETRKLVAWGIAQGLIKPAPPPPIDLTARDISPDLKRALAPKDEP